MVLKTGGNCGMSKKIGLILLVFLAGALAAGNELTMPACREAVSVNMLTVHVST